MVRGQRPRLKFFESESQNALRSEPVVVTHVTPLQTLADAV